MTNEKRLAEIKAVMKEGLSAGDCLSWRDLGWLIERLELAKIRIFQLEHEAAMRRDGEVSDD